MARQDKLPPTVPRFIWPTPEKSDLLFYIWKDGRLPENQQWDHGDAHPDATTYPDHKLLFVTPQGDDGWSRWYYVDDRVNQDDYNWEFSQADIGSRKFDSVERTYLRPRADFTHGDPAPGSAMPDTPAGMFAASAYLLAGREERRTGDEMFDTLYVIDRITYVRRVTLRDVVWDEATSSPQLVTETLHYRGETVSGDYIDSYFLDETDSFWGIRETGDLRTGEQLSAHWYLVTDRGVVPEAVGGVATIREYTGYVGQQLPAVLQQINMDTWNRRDGSYRVFPQVYYKRHAFSGEVRAAISEKWYASLPTLAGLQHLMPLPIVMSCPFFSLHVGPTLHASDTLTLTTGTVDPIWEYTGGNFYFPASRLVTEAATVGASTVADQTDWPDSLKVADDPQPYRGGWLRKEITLDLTFVKKGSAVYPP